MQLYKDLNRQGQFLLLFCSLWIKVPYLHVSNCIEKTETINYKRNCNLLMWLSINRSHYTNHKVSSFTSNKWFDFHGFEKYWRWYLLKTMDNRLPEMSTILGSDCTIAPDEPAPLILLQILQRLRKKIRVGSRRYYLRPYLEVFHN